MHRLLSLALALVFAVWCAFFQSALAGVPTILTQQGRLLDSGGGPLTGIYSITYSIFETPTGGAPLWTETHPAVSVEDGLFAVQLGSITPLDANLLTSGGGGGGGGGAIERYLEISVGGSVIAPRTRLVSSPYSVASSRVSGDIQTGPNRIVVGDLTGDGHADLMANPDSVVNDYVQDNSPNVENRVKIRVTPADAGVSMGHGGSTTATIRAATTGGHIGLGGMSGSTTGTIRMMAGPDSAITYLDVDSDDDGIPESSDRRTISANDVHHNVISRSGSTTGTIRMAASPDSASSILEWDSDNDGIPDCTAKEKGSSTGVSHTLLGGHSGSTTGTIRMAASGGGGPVLPSGSLLIEADLDGDGVADNLCSSESGGSGSSVVVSSRFGSGPRQTTSMDGSFSHAHMRCDSDSDGDGVQDNSVVSESSVSGASLRVISLNGLPPGVPVVDNIALTANGTSSSVALKKGVAQVGLGVVGGAVPGASILSSRCLSASGLDTASTEQSSDGFGAAMKAINTKGTGATVRVAATANDSGSVGTDCDDDDNGFSERATWTSSNPGIARSVVAADVDGDGDFDNLATQTCDATSSRMESSSTSGSGNGAKTASLTVSASPGGSACRAIATKGTGATLRCTSSADSAKAAMFLDSDDDGDGLAEVSAEMDVNPDSASFRLNGLPPGIPVTGTISMTATPTGVHMAVGAATCDGTNWVNASDKNSKENFEKVDGEDILEKISGLEITKWNYKGDEDAQHIGPTAQDFKKTFGVGADDKSISTIDPSGIALAAIKELNKQNLELKNQNIELKKELDDLKRLVNQIASKK